MLIVLVNMIPTITYHTYHNNLSIGHVYDHFGFILSNNNTSDVRKWTTARLEISLIRIIAADLMCTENGIV